MCQFIININLKCSRFCNMVCIFLFYLSIQEDGCMIGGVDRLTYMPKMFVSCLLFCWCLCIGWCNKNVQPISQCVLTSVSFIENRATHGPGSRDPGSLWCYCWITEGIGQQISRGLSAGWDWHCCVLQNGPNARRQHCQSFCMQVQKLGQFHCMLCDAK